MLKPLCVKSSCLLAIFFLLAGLYADTVCGAVNVAITPAAVSNTFNGPVSLQISGLTNGETVVVQKYLDANSSGILDAGDILVQQFDLTDGQASIYTNENVLVTNFNVPGDSDSTPGHITATLQLQNGDFTQSIIGNYLIVVSSSSGRFPSITNSFVVSNYPFAQTISGNVMSSGSNVPNALVILFAPLSGNGSRHSPVEVVVANSAGNFSVQVPPGSYAFLPWKSNFVANYLSSLAITVSNNQSATTNLTLTQATTGISGRIVDSANTNFSLPGIFEPLSNSNLFALGFSDSNGYGNFRVAPGDWGGGSSDSGLTVHGYVGYRNGTNFDASAGGVSNVVLPLFKATALFYGTVTDSLGNPMAGADVSAQDSYGIFSSDGFTDINGNYAVGAVGDFLGADDLWQLHVSLSDPTNLSYNPPSFNQNGGTNLNLGQAILFNFIVQFCGGIQIMADGLPNGQVGTFYDAYLEGETCSGSVDWALLDPQDFPPGLNLYSSGEINGMPSTSGQYNFSVQLSDGEGNSTNQALSLTVNGEGNPLEITTASIPNGASGIPYNFQLSATGGQAPYGWSVASGSPKLPSNLVLNANGIISGIPAVSGNFAVTVQVTDSYNNVSTKSFDSYLAPSRLPAPALSGSQTSEGQLQIALSGQPAGSYTIEYSTNLIDWASVIVTNPPSVSSLPLMFPIRTNFGFYRGFQSGILVSQSIFSFVQFAAGPPLITVIATNDSAAITVIRSNGLSNAVCLNYSTVGGSALAGCDYTPVSGTLCFPANVTSNSFLIPISLSCSPNQSETIQIQVADQSGTNVLNALLVIQRPQPVLAIYPTSFNIYVPNNCPQILTISNAGPHGSLLQYSLVDSGGLGGFLNFNSQGADAPATGMLPAGTSSEISISVLDQFAANWFGPAVVGPTILTPGAANYVEYSFPVAITPEVELLQNALQNEISWSGVEVYSNYSTGSGSTYYFPVSGTCSIDVDRVMEEYHHYTNITTNFNGTTTTSIITTSNYAASGSISLSGSIVCGVCDSSCNAYFYTLDFELENDFDASLSDQCMSGQPLVIPLEGQTFDVSEADGFIGVGASVELSVNPQAGTAGPCSLQVTCEYYSMTNSCTNEGVGDGVGVLNIQNIPLP